MTPAETVAALLGFAGRAPATRANCPYCGSGVKAMTGRELYGVARPGLHARLFMACARMPECDSYVGCHAKTGVPFGTLADRSLRAWRVRAHNAFDPLWVSGVWSRCEAYGGLAGQLGVVRGECHVALFDEQTCRRVVELCRAKAGAA